jgi:hypothetical protein
MHSFMESGDADTKLSNDIATIVQAIPTSRTHLYGAEAHMLTTRTFDDLHLVLHEV